MKLLLKSVLAIIFVVLLLFGIYILIESVINFVTFSSRCERETIRLEINLSKPGTFEGDLEETCGAHGEYLFFDINDVVINYENATEILDGLEGKLVITNSDQNIVHERLFEVKDFCDEPRPGIPSLYFYPFKNGTYHLKMIISKGVSGLPDTKQFIVGKYLLCGCEKLPAFAGFVIGGLSVSASLIFCVLFRLVRLKNKIVAEKCS
jgi:hypothetical protein